MSSRRLTNTTSGVASLSGMSQPRRCLINMGLPFVSDSIVGSRCRRKSRCGEAQAAQSAGAVPASVVPVDALVALVPLLRLQRQGRDGAGLEALQGDRLARLLAIAVGAVVDAGEGVVDLGDQLALPVAGAKLDGPVRLRG